ncbi:hypothetical protein UFOVP276_196 [uncultured Caudovirales phage]|uniref:Uncharacterized protein n=1 Tax=uncultured Caudovirales phage TaxID=2100421 RepID=A0A6J5LDJ3_9CAUD|nr:hypothetical protein UFOVP127_90 [uncultured Caudovirales phage]CAB4135240.1 hypothetical protein UFOVP276_196 [uncultured Caudovirales phage]
MSLSIHRVVKNVKTGRKHAVVGINGTGGYYYDPSRTLSQFFLEETDPNAQPSAVRHIDPAEIVVSQPNDIEKLVTRMPFTSVLDRQYKCTGKRALRIWRAKNFPGFAFFFMYPDKIMFQTYLAGKGWVNKLVPDRGLDRSAVVVQ